MRSPLWILAALFTASSALAQPVPQAGQPSAPNPSPAQAAQQQRMTDCNAQATQRKLAGTERQNFLGRCLSGSPRPAATSQSAPAQAARPTSPPGQVAAPSGASISHKVNLNTATPQELDQLPQIGPARAQAIIKGRPYKSVDELSVKKVIPANAYSAIKDLVDVR